MIVKDNDTIDERARGGESGWVLVVWLALVLSEMKDSLG